MNGTPNRSQKNIDSPAVDRWATRLFTRKYGFRYWITSAAVALITSSFLWLAAAPSIRAGQAGKLSTSSADSTLFIPAMMASVDEVQGLSTPDPVSTITPTAVVPTAIVPTTVPTVEATATPTSLPSTVVRFEGSTDQGQPILIEAAPGLSTITRFKMNAQIICDTTSGLVSIDLVDQLGYDVVNNRFQIRSDSPGGNVNVFMGTLSESGVQMSGTWSVWLDGVEPFQPCSNKGDWSATVSTFR